MKKFNKIGFIIVSFALIVNCFLLSYLIFQIKSVENILRFLIILFILNSIVYLIYSTIVNLKTEKKLKKLIITYLILSIMITILNTLLFNIYFSIKNLSSNYNKYSSVVLSKEDEKIENIKNNTIGIVEDYESIDNYIIPNEIIEKYSLNENNTIIYYETISDIFNDLRENQLDYAIVSSNYKTYLNEDETFIEIYSKEKDIKNKKTYVSIIEEPITILLLGLDNNNKNIKTATSFLADTIILITFNPKTYNSTILSIPRDTYLPIACNNNVKDKINHAGSYGGEKCLIKTIENFTNIKINHFVKMNFKGIVDLVDTIDGIEVDVPYAFCEQDSERNFKNLIYVEKGLQTLNGEQALALSRNRDPHSNICSAKYTKGTRNDFIRNENQQKVLNALLNKAKKTTNINQIYSLLKIIESNISSSIDINEITPFYNILKKIITYNINFNFDQLHISGFGNEYYINETTKRYYFIPFKQSIADITNAMNVNLNIVEPTLIKNFDFSIDKIFVKETIGAQTHYDTKLLTLPELTNKTISEAKHLIKNYNIKLEINYIETDNIELNNIVYKQNYPSNTIIEKIRTLKLTVYEYKKNED